MRRRHRRSQTKSIFNFTDFYPWSKLQAGRKQGREKRKRGRIAEESGESLKLDKVRENRGRWNPFRIGNDLFTRAFTNTHDFPGVYFKQHFLANVSVALFSILRKYLPISQNLNNVT